MVDYSKYRPETVILQKTASAFGWDYEQTFEKLDVDLLIELLELQSELEKDQNAFVSPHEAAIYKNLLRQYGEKKEDDK